MKLQWPLETASGETTAFQWSQPGSNVVLDFHGDPLKAQLVVFSDGNHHMALMPSLRAFGERRPEVGEIFYATTPPGPLVSLLKTGALALGNLVLSLRPHLFISPPHVLERLQQAGLVASHCLLALNRGSVFLVRHGNPKAITDIADLMREDVRLFISNPEEESVRLDLYHK